MSQIPLCQLKKNQSGTIVGIFCPSSLLPEKEVMIRRFLDLGFCKGTMVTCVNISFFRNPHAYLIRGSVIALRNEDASMIMVSAEP